MSWQGIEGHDAVVELFRRCLARGRLASTFLFVGPPGVGKRTFALRLAQALLCARSAAEALDPCGACPACAQVLAGSHPDVHVVRKPADKSNISIDLLVGPKERRGQEGLCHDIALKPFSARRKVAVIDDADYLFAEGANALLKTLEEPPPGSLLILIGTAEEKQLPTIRSRCQTIRFQPLEPAVVARLLLAAGAAADAAEAERLARFSEGSLARAAELADPALWEFRGKLLAALARRPLESVELARPLTAFVDEAGKDAPPRRARARQLLRFAADFYAQLLRELSGAALTDDPELRHAVEAATPAWAGGDDAAAACTERCLDALEHIDRNANLTTALECWLDALSRLSAPRATAAPARPR